MGQDTPNTIRTPLNTPYRAAEVEKQHFKLIFTPTTPQTKSVIDGNNR
jgi:hypothetical protein